MHLDRHRLQLLIACQLATFIIAALVTTIGLIVPVAAEHFGVPVTEMAAQFTWFTGAGFVGQVLSFVIFDYFSIKRVLLYSHAACALALLGVHYTEVIDVLPLALIAFGVGISFAVCGSSTLITQLWDGRARQSAIVAQDAMFNGGGVIFAALTSWFIINGWPFSSTYVLAAIIGGLVIALISLSSFASAGNAAQDQDEPVVTTWNARILLIGFSLLLFMTAKISLFIWAPQYIAERFADAQSINAATVAGDFMANVFMAAFIGAMLGAALVARIPVRYLVYSLVCLSAVSVLLLTRLDTLDGVLLLGYAYGLSVSATFNAYVAFALAQVSVPSHRNIAFMLLMSSLGSSFAPLLSSQVVTWQGRMESAISAAFALLVVVIASLVVTEVLAHLARRREGTQLSRAAA